MLREFSKELAEDRRFEIGNEVFEFVYPYWEEMASIFDEDLSPNGDGEFTFKADTELAIRRVPIFLNKTDHARWKKLVTRKENPVPRHQIVQVYRWLVEQASGLPTTPPSDSASGGGESEDSSPAG